MAQFTGTCVVRMDGLSLQSKDKAKIEIGGFERTAVYTDHSFAGFVEKPICSKVTFTAAHSATLDLIAIRNAKNVSIEFETDGGVAFLVANAFCVKPPELTGGDGDVAIEFMGKEAVQR